MVDRYVVNPSKRDNSDSLNSYTQESFDSIYREVHDKF